MKLDATASEHQILGVIALALQILARRSLQVVSCTEVTMFRYITKEEFRVLTAVEMGMRLMAAIEALRLLPVSSFEGTTSTFRLHWLRALRRSASS